MTGTDLCVNKPHMFRSYMNHLVVCNNSQLRDASYKRVIPISADVLHLLQKLCSVCVSTS